MMSTQNQLLRPSSLSDMGEMKERELGTMWREAKGRGTIYIYIWHPKSLISNQVEFPLSKFSICVTTSHVMTRYASLACSLILSTRWFSSHDFEPTMYVLICWFSWFWTCFLMICKVATPKTHQDQGNYHTRTRV